MYAAASALLFTAWISSPTGPPARVLVRNVVADEVHARTAAAATDALLIALSRRAGVYVISERELHLIGEHAQALRALAGCTGPECANALRGFERVDKLVTSRLTALGDALVLSVKLLDLKKTALERAGSCLEETDTHDWTVCARRIAETLSTLGARDTPPVVSRTTKLVVTALEHHGVSEAIGQTTTELVLLELKRFAHVDAISSSEVHAMLSYEAKRQLLTCENDEACLVEIAGALNARFIVGGSIGKTDNTFAIHLKLMQVRPPEVARRASVTYDGPARDLRYALQEAVRELLGVTSTDAGKLTLRVGADNVRATNDGGTPAPLEAVDGSTLAAGKHTLSLFADGHHPLHREFFVSSGRTTHVRAELEARDRPWYAAWWVWALVGTAASAAGSAAILANQSGERTGTIGGRFEDPMSAR